MKKAMLASMEMAPAITAVIVMVRVSRCFTWPSSCARTPANSSWLTWLSNPVVTQTAA